MRTDLLSLAASRKDTTNVIVLTHNVDFAFLQTLVLSHLRRGGDPSLTILADRHQAVASFDRQRDLLDGLGTRYRVVPVEAAAGFVFHPKAVLLSGPEDADLFVGSGNLTFGGFRQNAEVWSHYTALSDGIDVFERFRSYIERIADRQPMAESLLDEIADAFDARNKHWANIEPQTKQSQLIFPGREGTLLAQMTSVFGPEPVDALYICSPYFDPNGDALAAMVETVRPRTGELLHPVSGSTLTAGAWSRVSGTLKRRPCEIRHQHAINNSRGFVHAKFYAVVRGDQATIIQGSANCSRAALMVPAPRGNFELMSIVHTSATDLQENWLNVLEHAETVIPLPETIPLEASSDIESEHIRIQAAQGQGGQLHVAYSPHDAMITECAVDGALTQFRVPEPGMCEVTIRPSAHVVELTATAGDGQRVTTQHWIDNEQLLQSTARVRSVLNAIPAGTNPDAWDKSQWLTLLESIGENLIYTPARVVRGATDRSENQANQPTVRQYEELFATDYAAANILSDLQSHASGQGALQNRSIRNILLSFLGVNLYDEVIDEDLLSEEDEKELDSKTRTKQHSQPRSDPTNTKPTFSDKDQKLLQDILIGYEVTLTSSGYLEQRPAHLLRQDLIVLANIMQLGKRQGWLDEATFFSFTHVVWATMFLSSNLDEAQGALTWRRDTAPDSKEFLNELCDPQLSASLVAWMLLAHDARPGLQHARFTLSLYLSSARLPEIWITNRVATVQALQEMQQLGRGNFEKWSDEKLASIWHDVLAAGKSLNALESELHSHGTAELRRLLTNEIQPASQVFTRGDLLWQGAAGYAVALESGDLTQPGTVDVQKLQKTGIAKFVSNGLIPVRLVTQLDTIKSALPPTSLSRIYAIQDELSVAIQAQGHSSSH